MVNMSGLMSGAAGGATVAIVIKAIDQFSSVFKNVNTKLLAAGAALTTIGIMGVKVMSGWVTAAGDAQEVFSRFDVIFGGIGDKAEAVAKDLRDNFGLAESSAKKLLASTGDLLTGFGMNETAALGMSEQIAKLGSDLASFQDLEGGATQAVNILNRSILGERESLKTLGVSILDVDVKQRLMELGMDGLTGQARLEAQAIATLQLIMEQTERAQGDFARTQTEFNNTMKTLKERTKEAREEMGKHLLPIVTKVAGWIQNLVTWFNDLSEGQKKFIAITFAVVTALTLVAGIVMMIVALKAALVLLFVSAATAIWGAVTASLAFVAANIWWIAIVAAVIIAIVLLVKYWDVVKAALFALGNWFMVVFKMIGDVFKASWKIYKGYFLVLVGILKWLGAKWAQAWVGMALILANTWNSMIDMSETLVNNFIETIIGPINWVRKMLGKETWTLDLDFSKAKIETETLQKTFDKLKGVTLESSTAPGMELIKEGVQGIKDVVDDVKGGALNIAPMFNKQLEDIKTKKALEEEVTKELEKQKEVVDSISKEQTLVNKLEGYEYNKYTGDIWNPKSFKKSEFETPEAFESAKEWGGLTINIENVNGLDPEEISKALSNELSNKVSL